MMLNMVISKTRGVRGWVTDSVEVNEEQLDADSKLKVKKVVKIVKEV